MRTVGRATCGALPDERLVLCDGTWRGRGGCKHSGLASAEYSHTYGYTVNLGVYAVRNRDLADVIPGGSPLRSDPLRERSGRNPPSDEPKSPISALRQPKCGRYQRPCACLRAVSRAAPFLHGGRSSNLASAAL